MSNLELPERHLALFLGRNTKLKKDPELHLIPRGLEHPLIPASILYLRNRSNLDKASSLDKVEPARRR